MKNLTILLLLGSFLTFIACTKNSDQENMPELDQIFQLKISEPVVFVDQEISIIAESVVEDNRCPSNVDCISAGWVTVSFHVTIGAIEYFFQLTLDPNKPQDAETEVGGYKIRIVTVNPYPTDSNEIDLEDYSFSLVVENE
jgi:hypothetical protein